MKTEAYHIDSIKVRNLENKAERVIRHANKLLEVYTNVTGLQIKEPAEILSLAVDAESQYKREALKVSKAKFPKGILDLPGLDLSTLVSTPDDFYKVTEALNSFDFYSHLQPGFFKIEDNKLVTSDEFKQYVIESCSHFAVSPDEKKRLDLCNELIQAYQRMESVVAQLPNGKQIIALQDHVPKALSKYLLLVSEESELRGAASVSTKNKLVPNPDWIRDRKVKVRIISKPRKFTGELDLSGRVINHFPESRAPYTVTRGFH